MTIIERSRLRALSTEQVLNIASTQITAGNIGKWPRIRRLWTDKNMDRTACETELAWAMGYTAIKEDNQHEPINHHRSRHRPRQI